MRRLLLVLLILVSTASFAFADVWVNGYTRKDGTYVSGHYRSDPNGTKSDNWSTKGNVNPYTGKKGYKSYSGFGGNSGFGNGYGKKKDFFSN